MVRAAFALFGQDNGKHRRLRLNETKEYVIRTQSTVANTFALGQVVAPNCAFFAKGDYDLSKDELNAKLKKLGKVTLR